MLLLFVALCVVCLSFVHVFALRSLSLFCSFACCSMCVCCFVFRFLLLYSFVSSVCVSVRFCCSLFRALLFPLCVVCCFVCVCLLSRLNGFVFSVAFVLFLRLCCFVF